MKTVGFDPGSTKTGYCVLENDAIVEAGVIRMVQSQPIQDRLATLMVEAGAILDAHKPTLVGIESPFINPKFKSAVIPLSCARGVLMAVSAYRDAKVVSVSPSEVKRVTGAGPHAQKIVVQSLMHQRFKMKDVPPPDVADAIAVALAASLSEGNHRPAEDLDVAPVQ